MHPSLSMPQKVRDDDIQKQTQTGENSFMDSGGHSLLLVTQGASLLRALRIKIFTNRLTLTRMAALAPKAFPQIPFPPSKSLPTLSRPFPQQETL